jgi:MSHA biogenesis protein MshL
LLISLFFTTFIWHVAILWYDFVIVLGARLAYISNFLLKRKIMLKKTGNKFSIRYVALCAVCAFGSFALAGCDLAENQLKMDRAANMEFQDFRDGLAPRPLEDDVDAAGKFDDDIPAMQTYVAAPSDNMKAMPLVTVSVNQTVPLRDVLYELAKQADYDLELDPRIRGSIIFSARERPFDVVIKRIADISGLRYNFEDDILRVEVDTPYQKLYKIDYLSYIRTNSGSISNNVAVVSGEGADTGSRFQAVTESEVDFWGELDTNLTQILGLSRRAASLMTANDPELTAAAQNPAPVVPVVADGDGGVTVQAPNPVLQVNSLPNVASTGGRGNNTEDFTQVEATFALNKQAGIVSVFATERQHKQVAEYMHDVERSVTAQVLVEAKILEVGLTDEFSAGIDWNVFTGNNGGLGLDVASATSIRPSLDPVILPSADFFAAFVSQDLNVFAEAMSRFGTVRALASPRLTVLNNQSAVLNVADNQVYFELDIDVTRDGDSDDVSVEVDTDIRNVPEGVLINVQPSINLDKRTISMSVRPTVTRIVDFVDDPGVAFIVEDADLDGGIVSRIPVVNVQEMDSVIKMNSGQAIVMGGLMQDSVNSEQNSVPVLGEMPVFGALFRSQNDKISKSELVIFLKATIIDTTNVDETDKDLYRKFGHDRRPLNL